MPRLFLDRGSEDTRGVVESYLHGEWGSVSIVLCSLNQLSFTDYCLSHIIRTRKTDESLNQGLFFNTWKAISSISRSIHYDGHPVAAKISAHQPISSSSHNHQRIPHHLCLHHFHLPSILPSHCALPWSQARRSNKMVRILLRAGQERPDDISHSRTPQEIW